MKPSTLLFLLFLLCHNGQKSALAQPIVETFGRIELNWSSQRIKFYGIGDEGDFTKSDRAAWQEGLAYLVKNLPKVRSKYKVLAGDNGAQAAHRVASATYRVKTHYYANGVVKVEMESQLSRALSPMGLTFEDDHPAEEDSKNSKILIVLDEPFSPTPLFEVVAGEDVVYSYRSVAKSAFERSLLGGFYQGRKQKTFGKNPIILKGRQKDGSITVSKDAWEKAITGNKGLLSRAGIAISFPGKG